MEEINQLENIDETQGCSVKTSNPWKFWPTLSIALAIGGVSLFAQFIFGIGWAIFAYALQGSLEAETLARNGNFLLGCTLFANPIVAGLMCLAIKKRPDNSLLDYLAIRKVSWKQIALWTGGLMLLLVVMEVIVALLNNPPQESMVLIFSSSHPMLLVITIVFVAPLVEELFFRGFMYRGLAASRVGVPGAIVLSTLCWVALHGFQYDGVALFYLMMLGILLGYARFKTNSVLVPLFLHFLNNLISTVMMMAYVNQGLI